MKSILLNLVVLSLILSLLPSQGQADDINSIRRRPSYQQVIAQCRGDLSFFKLDLYNKTYQDSLRNSLKVMSLSPTAITTIINTRGASPFLDAFLDDPATVLALNECFSDFSDHMAFVRNLIVVDSLGKLVGIAIGAVAAKTLEFVGEKVFASMAVISPWLARSARITTVIVTSGFAFQRIKKDYEEFRNSSREGVEASDAEAAQIEKELSHRLEQAATEQIKKINDLLKDPELTPQQRASLEKELHRWGTVARNF